MGLELDVRGWCIREVSDENGLNETANVLLTKTVPVGSNALDELYKLCDFEV